MEKRKGPRSSHRQIEIVHLKNHVIVLIVLLKNPSDSKDSWWMIAGESPPSCGHKATKHPGCYSVVHVLCIYGGVSDVSHAENPDRPPPSAPRN